MEIVEKKLFIIMPCKESNILGRTLRIIPIGVKSKNYNVFNKNHLQNSITDTNSMGTFRQERSS